MLICEADSYTGCRCCEWGPILTGQAEIAGVPDELLDVFSKRSVAISVAMAAKLDDFRRREGRAPSRFECAAMEREASADTRSRGSPATVPPIW